MLRQILTRVITALATIFAIITISFFMARFMPGDVLQHLVGQEEYYYLLENQPQELERISARYGLNDPL